MEEWRLLALAGLALCAGFAQPVLFPRWPVPARAAWGLSTLALATVLVAFAWLAPRGAPAAGRSRAP